VYEFDHQYPGLDSAVGLPLVVLYGELGTPEFAKLHSTLSGMAANRSIRYTVRHYYKVMVTFSLWCVLVGVCVAKGLHKAAPERLWRSPLSQEH
jgi:hypothetical protein